MSSRRRAFTLVELLVVIGIIAVLIGILVPTLAGARRNAATVKCASNLRSLGQTIYIYANEHRGYVPTYRSTFGTTRVQWYDQLARYVYSRPATGSPPSIINVPGFEATIFAGCPNYRFELAGVVSDTGTGYGINSLPVAPLAPPNVLTKDRYNVYQHPPAPPAVYTPPGRYFKLREFRNPTNRALMADMNGWGGLRALDPDPLYYTKPGEIGVQGDIDYYRHGRYLDLTRTGANVLFVDGHVEICTPWQAWWAVRNPSRRASGHDKGP
jgi:prepilin-type N-terminal cleavage/methylation domain-containing protein/prepilin-type processing-associated H-X9-DG protein